MNPVTKKYLQKIEKAYITTKNSNEGNDRDSLDSRGAKVDGPLFEKYKAMRDTAIDIGKWINGGVNNGKKSSVKNDILFMEHRANRNASHHVKNGQGKESAMRMTSYENPAFKTPGVTGHNFNQTSATGTNILKDGFPNLSPMKTKSND